MPGQDAASEALLLDALRDEASRRPLTGILLIGMQSCGTINAVNRLVRSSAAVTLLHLDRASGAVGCGLGNPEHFLGDARGPGGPADETARPFSLIAVNVEAAKSYRLLREILGQIPRYLDAAGVVLVAGPKKGGAEVAARTLEQAFASISLLAYRKGHRIYRAAGPRPPADADQHDQATAPGPDDADRASAPATAQVTPTVETVVLRDRELRLLLDDRIFARGRLDPATRMLAEAFQIPRGAAVLDLGSGNGALGILAALLEPTSQVTLVDSDPLAVDVSRRNAALNGVGNVSAHLSDVLDELPGQTFDVVLMNPPFHRGRVHDRSLAERFIAEASSALRPRGAIFVVCNRFLRYEPTVERLVGPVREIVGDRQFKVLTAMRSAALQSDEHGGHDGRAGQQRAGQRRSKRFTTR